MKWVLSKKSNELRVMSTVRVLVLIWQLADLLQKKKKSVTRITFLCLSCLIWERKRFEISAVSGCLWVYHSLILKQKYQENSSKAGTLSVLSISHSGPVHHTPRAAEWTNRGARHKQPTNPHHLTSQCLGSDFFLSPSNFKGHFLSFSHLCIFPISHLLLYGNMSSFMSSLKRLIKIAFPLKKKKKGQCLSAL